MVTPKKGHLIVKVVENESTLSGIIVKGEKYRKIVVVKCGEGVSYKKDTRLWLKAEAKMYPIMKDEEYVIAEDDIIAYE